MAAKKITKNKTMKKTVNKKTSSKKQSSKSTETKPEKTEQYDPVERLETTFKKTKIQLKEADIQKDTKNLLWIIVGVILIFALFFAIRFMIPDADGAKSIDEMHELNLAGKIKNESSAYVYNGFSFVRVGNVWYTQILKGSTIYDVTFNHAPKEVENIPVEGSLTREFIDSKKFYIAFDPEGEDLEHITVANSGLSNSLVRAFGIRDLEAGCTKNVTDACANAPILSCDDEDKQIFLFKEDPEAKVVFDGNCVIMQGSEDDIVKAKDRLLLRWYNIMR